MNKFKSKIIHFSTSIQIFVAVLLASHHLICTLLYLLPINPSSKYYYDHVSNYMNPFFAQRWTLFAPEPQTSQLKLFYRCENNSEWSDWKDPTYMALEKHHIYRFGYFGKIIYVFNAVSRELFNKTLSNSKEGKLIDSIIDTSEFLDAEKIVSRLCNNIKNFNAERHEFKILQIYPKNFSERKTPGHLGKIITIKYPIGRIINDIHYQ